VSIICGMYFLFVGGNKMDKNELNSAHSSAEHCRTLALEATGTAAHPRLYFLMYHLQHPSVCYC
jgi:hypothetical protein